VEVDDDRGGAMLVASPRRVDMGRRLGAHEVVVPYCPTCGAVLGVLPRPSREVVVEEYTRSSPA
jgi:hypothetical protein